LEELPSTKEVENILDRTGEASKSDEAASYFFPVKSSSWAAGAFAFTDATYFFTLDGDEYISLCPMISLNN